MEHALLTIEPLQEGVRFVSATAEVEVDCSRHTLRLGARRCRSVEFASSRRGVEGMTVRVLMAAAPIKQRRAAAAARPSQDELFAVAPRQVLARTEAVDVERLRATIGAALVAALGRSAARAWQSPVLLQDVVDLVDAVAPTPLVFSPSVRAARWFVQDVTRHRPAAIALALVEERAPGWERLDVVGARLDALSRWQSFYAPGREVTRALTKTLADFGADAAPQDLWALRRVALSRPVPSALHLAVLAELSRVAPEPGPNLEVVRLVEEAREADLVGSIERVAEALRQPRATQTEKLHLFAELLTQRRDAVGRLRLGGVVRAQLQVGPRAGARQGVGPRRDRIDGAIPTVRPPIPLPDEEGVTFLGTVGALYAEGERMRHCVGTHATSALRGGSYVFHVEHDGDQATVELDARGMVLEVAGPANVRATPACRHAHLVLARWALPLRVAVLGAWTQSVWHAPAPAVAEGRALLTLADVVELAQRWCRRMDVDVLSLMRWLVEQTTDALEGRAWLVETPWDVVALGADGAVRGRRGPDHGLSGERSRLPTTLSS